MLLMSYGAVHDRETADGEAILTKKSYAANEQPLTREAKEPPAVQKERKGY